MRAEHPNPLGLAIGITTTDDGKWRVFLLTGGAGAAVPVEFTDREYAAGFAQGMSIALGFEVINLAEGAI